MKLEHREPSAAAIRAAQRDIDEAEARADQAELQRAQQKADLIMALWVLGGMGLYYLILWLL